MKPVIYHGAGWKSAEKLPTHSAWSLIHDILPRIGSNSTNPKHPTDIKARDVPERHPERGMFPCPGLSVQPTVAGASCLDCGWEGLGASITAMLQFTRLFQEVRLCPGLWKEVVCPHRAEQPSTLPSGSFGGLQGQCGAQPDLSVFDLLLQEWYEEHSRKEETQTPLQEPASASNSSVKPLSLRQRSQTVI